jgi:hypothetical protein
MGVVQVQRNAAIDDRSSVAIALEPEMVDDQIAVDPAGDLDQGGTLDRRADVDDLGPPVEIDSRAEYVVPLYSDNSLIIWDPDVGPEDRYPCSEENFRSGCVLSDPGFYCTPVISGDVFADTPFNTFILAHEEIVH